MQILCHVGWAMKIVVIFIEIIGLWGPIVKTNHLLLQQVHFWCFTSRCSSIAIYRRFVERFLPIVKKKRSYSILLKGGIGAVLSQATLTLNLFIKATWRGQTHLTRTEFYRIVWINLPPNLQHLGSHFVRSKTSWTHPVNKWSGAGFVDTRKPSSSTVMI